MIGFLWSFIEYFVTQLLKIKPMDTAAVLFAILIICSDRSDQIGHKLLPSKTYNPDITIPIH